MDTRPRMPGYLRRRYLRILAGEIVAFIVLWFKG
jgi:hypothetical protein